MNLRDLLEAANAPRPAPVDPVRTPATPWQLEWASRNRQIANRLHAIEREKNDARVLDRIRQRTGTWTTAELARSLRVNTDWLRKHPLRRLCAAGKIEAIVVMRGDWPARRDWRAIP